jgi:hypothetical protein
VSPRRRPINVRKLSIQFDAAKLQSELERIDASEWIRHFNTENFEGEWSGVALRSVGGQAGQLYPLMAAPELFTPTDVLLRCAYFQDVLNQFLFPLTAVRLLKLSAGSRILKHHDDRLGYGDGQVRLHVPIVTHPDVDFRLDGERIAMGEGECWYLDLTRPHWCANESGIDRVHLVLDGIVNEWVTDMLGNQGI